ncbi:MAG: LCP family protein [Selenomonadaceae bacterium]|nr:LCP family protein [Selenomonadaceae bacterium]
MFAESSLFDDKEPSRKISGTDDKPEELIKARNKVTILIMGVDRREDDVGRSDTLMIATVDPRLDQATLLSIPRDTRVKIYGRGYDKINAAFAYGGVGLTESTVENFLGIDIDHYILIDTSSFVKIIDAIGGVDIDVEKRMFYEDPWDDNGGLVIDLYPGQQHMDGKTAVTYVRYRDSEGDIGRVKRQQAFMAACLDKVTSPEIVTRIPKILREVIDAVETDMSLRQLLEVAGALKAAQQNGLETDMVPGYPLYIDEISYWIPDVELLRLSVADALGISVDPMLRERFERAAREYNDSIPDGAKDVPDDDDSIGRPVRESRERRRVDDRTTSTPRRTYDDDRTRYNERYNYEDDRDSVTSRRSYDSDRTRSTDRQTFDSDRTTSTDRRTFDDDRTTSTDRQTFDSDRTTSTDRRTFDSDRTTSTDRQTFDNDRTRSETPQIERRDIPDTNFSEPSRDDASKTRY